MKTKKCIYLHGGPGFSSYPEQAMLNFSAKQNNLNILFWNEPSKNRPDGPIFNHANSFSNSFASVRNEILRFAQDEQILLIGQSFGVHLITRLLNENSQNLPIAGLVLISPAFALLEAHRNIIHLAIHDFRQSDMSKSRELSRLLALSRTLMDENFVKAFSLAVQDPFLFDHYWENQKLKLEFMKHLSRPEAQLDVDCFFGVLKEFKDLPPLPASVVSEKPTLVLYGGHDPVIDHSLERKLISQYYPSAKTTVFPFARHWPHIEEMYQFFKLINEFVNICL